MYPDRSRPGAKEVSLTGTVTRSPIRTCVGCRSARPKRELLRIARTPDGVQADPDARLPGRGAYVCPDPSCLVAARRRKATALRRALRGAGEHEVDQALDALSTAVRYEVPRGTVRSENA